MAVKFYKVSGYVKHALAVLDKRSKVDSDQLHKKVSEVAGNLDDLLKIYQQEHSSEVDKIIEKYNRIADERKAGIVSECKMAEEEMRVIKQRITSLKDSMVAIGKEHRVLADKEVDALNERYDQRCIVLQNKMNTLLEAEIREKYGDLIK